MRDGFKYIIGFLTTAALAFCLYEWLFGQDLLQKVSHNLFVFISWFTLILVLLGLMSDSAIYPKSYSNFVRIIHTVIDTCFVVLLVATGHFGYGSMWLLITVVNYALWERSKKLKVKK